MIFPLRLEIRLGICAFAVSASVIILSQWVRGENMRLAEKQAVNILKQTLSQRGIPIEASKPVARALSYIRGDMLVILPGQRSECDPLRWTVNTITQQIYPWQSEKKESSCFQELSSHNKHK